jgi:hypothetical protein
MLRKTILFVLFSFCVIVLFAQTDQVNPKSKNNSRDKIVPFQMGNGKTDNGTYTIKFDNPIETDYVITITPSAKGASLYVAEQTKEKATIRSSDGSVVPFQFIVFVKRAVNPADSPQMQLQEPGK